MLLCIFCFKLKIIFIYSNRQTNQDDLDPFSSSLILSLIQIIILLFFSGLISGTETAFFAIDKTTRNLLENDDSASSKRVLKLLEDNQNLLITILIMNNIINIVIAVKTTILTQLLAETYNWNFALSMGINVVLITFILLLVGEIIPKVYAIKDSLYYAKRVSLFILIVQTILKPISKIFQKFTDLFTKAMNVEFNPTQFSEEELKTLIDISEETGTIENEEKEMISSIMDFSDTTVKEVMVPRIDMIAVDSTTQMSEFIAQVKESHFSRIPIYEERIDNIIGIVYIKDLISYIGKDSLKDVTLPDLVHKAYYVPEQKKIQDLLNEFQSQKMHMAIVVDEYGGTSGLVTLEDIIEEIVGEIQDEYDFEEPLINQIDESNYEIDGKLQIEEFNENLPIDIPEEDGVETISGFIHHLTGKLPEESDIINYENFEFTIKEVDNRRINKIHLTIHDKNNNSDDVD